MRKKILCILLSLAMVITMMPMATVTAFAGATECNAIMNAVEDKTYGNTDPSKSNLSIPFSVDRFFGETLYMGYFDDTQMGNMSAPVPYCWTFLAKAMAGTEPAAATMKVTVSSDGNSLFTVEDVDGTRIITLLDDVIADDGDERLVIPAGKNVVLDLNGHTLDRALENETSPVVKGNAISVAENGKLTIEDNSASKKGKITGGTSAYGAAIITNGDTVFKNGSIIDCKVISNTYVENNGRGGAVFVGANGKFTLSDGKIENCSASVAGGAVFVVGDMNMTGGKITGCFVSGLSEDSVVKAKGGAIYLYSTSKFNMTGGKIIKNKLGNVADTRGAGLYIAQGADSTLGGTAKIMDNKVVGTNIKSNMFIYDNVLINIATGDSAPQTGMNVGVTIKKVLSEDVSGCAISTVCSKCDSYFFADRRNEKVEYSEGCLKLIYSNSGGSIEPTDTDKFQDYKVSQNIDLDKLLDAEDSDAVKELVANAKAEILALQYEDTKSLDENKARVDAIVNNLKIEVQSQRDKEIVSIVKVVQNKLKAYKGKKIRVSFKRVSWGKALDKKISDYQVYRSTKKTKSFKKVATLTKKTSKTIKYYNKKGLKRGKKYYYKVRGRIKLANGKYAYTKWSSVRSVRCK